MNPSVKTLTIEQAEAKGWNDMVAVHPLGSVFQHTAFLRTIAATFGQTRPYCVSLLDDNERCLGGLALFRVKSWLTGCRLVSIPFAFYADPMIDSREEFEALFQEVLQLSKQEKASYIEIKALNSTRLLAESSMVPVYYHKTYYLDLTRGLDALWEDFHRSCVKQKIRRAERAGIQVRLASSEEEVHVFRQILAKNRKALGLPPHKPEYFQNVWRYLAPQGLAQFWVASLHGQMVGGLCTFSLKETVFLAYVATEESLRQDGLGQYLWWCALRAASEEKRKIVDTGKTSPDDQGLVHYKLNWGTTELDTPVFYYPQVKGVSSFDNDRNPVYRLIRLFWRTMPLRLSGIPSRFMYRHMG